MLTPVFAATFMLAAPQPDAGDQVGVPQPVAPKEYGPFFEAEPVSETAHATQPRKSRYPVLSVGKGAFCFVEGTYCKSNLLISADVAAGLRIPASDKGPDLPHAQYTFRGGFVLRPLMLGKKRDWHPWALGAIGSWSRGTGAVTVSGGADSQEIESTDRTDAARVALINQIWLSKKKHAFHLDVTLGAVNSDVLTSRRNLWGTHAEVGFGFGGWGSLFASGDFLDDDTRVVFGFRAHGILAAPIIGLALSGLAIGGAL